MVGNVQWKTNLFRCDVLCAIGICLLEMRLVYQKVETRLSNEFLNVEFCGDRIVEMSCTCLKYKHPTLSEKDAETRF